MPPVATKSHSQFILAYQNGTLGFSVSVFRAILLFFSDRVDRSRIKVVSRFFFIFPIVLVGASFLLFAYVPLVWAIVGSAMWMAVSALVISHGVAELVIEMAIEDELFFCLAVEQGTLLFCTNDEGYRHLERPRSVKGTRRARR